MYQRIPEREIISADAPKWDYLRDGDI